MESLINVSVMYPIQKGAVHAKKAKYACTVPRLYGCSVVMCCEKADPMRLSSLNVEQHCSGTGEDSSCLKELMVDSQRASLLRKLSHANQQNRLLKRQLHAKEESLLEFQGYLIGILRRIEHLLKLENDRPSDLEDGNGGEGHSPLFPSLEAIRAEITSRIGTVELVRSRAVRLVWYGMAQSVQVMGSFDGWSQGEHLSSSEYDGSCMRFSTTLSLMPGRYEIKFLVDDNWCLSPQFPTCRDGLMKNNLLIVK